MSTVRWNLLVSSEIDKSVQQHLSQDGEEQGDLSVFVEKAVKAYLFKSAAAKIKQAFAGMPEEEIQALIDEAIQWARSDTNA